VYDVGAPNGNSLFLSDVGVMKSWARPLGAHGWMDENISITQAYVQHKRETEHEKRKLLTASKDGVGPAP
jgi:hypothetical protein